MSAVTCNTCGAEVDEASGLPLEERKPCPTCGGMTRMIEVGATISISTAASATGTFNASCATFALTRVAERTGCPAASTPPTMYTDPPSVTALAWPTAVASCPSTRTCPEPGSKA